MKINKHAFELVGISLEDYILWCEDNNKPSYKAKTKEEFFKKIRNNQIVRDTKKGKLVSVRSDSKIVIKED